MPGSSATWNAVASVARRSARPQLAAVVGPDAIADGRCKSPTTLRARLGRGISEPVDLDLECLALPPLVVKLGLQLDGARVGT